MNQYSLYGQRLSETFPRVLQITSGNTVLDGSGDTRSLYVNGNFSADTIYLGPADLYNVFAPIGAIGSGATTFIRNGLNIYTGGTSTSPTINISAATLNYLSATTIFGDILFSGATNLYDIFAGVGTSASVSYTQIAFGSSASTVTSVSSLTYSDQVNTKLLTLSSPNGVNNITLYTDNADTIITGSNLRITGGGANLKISTPTTGNISFRINTSDERMYVDGNNGDVKVKSFSATTFSADTIQSNSLSGITTRFVQTNSSGILIDFKLYGLDDPTKALLEDRNNWYGGSYTGTTIAGTLQGQKHYNIDYLFEAVENDLFIRVPRV